MRLRSETFVRNLARGCLLGGSLTPVLIYLLIGYAGIRQMAAEDAKVQAQHVGHTISANAEVWRFATERLADQIAEFRHERTQSRLTDTSGKLLAKIGEDCTGICISDHAPLMDYGKVVGELAVEIDIVPMLLRGSVVGVLGLAIGFLLLRLLNHNVLDPLERTRKTNIELSFYDPLTRLPNRRLLMDRLGHALLAGDRSRKYGALMIMDLDNFKDLNDTQGHDVGDRLLIEVAKRIAASLRQEDTVSRFGGDEFVVMLEGLDQDQASAAKQTEVIAEKIHYALNQPYAVCSNGQATHSTPSIGVTLFCGKEPSVDVLLKQADVALYRAKDAGRNAIRFFNPEMQRAIDSRSEMETALHNSLQAEELQLFYQPQVDQNGCLTGAEALLRWLPQGREPISPAEFIPLAEDTGLIIPMGLWVMQTACAQLKTWADSPLTRDLQIAINVSARQFAQPDFVEKVRDTLRISGADPAMLQLELTESMVLESIDKVIDRMQQIKALGVSFALDDFGTGFSSLSYLKKLPLDQLKIDRSFVREVSSDPNDAAIVRAIIAMSHSLGMQVIAEGVETEAQRDFLNNNGCTHYQGYLFGKPVPINEWGTSLSASATGLQRNAPVELRLFV